MGIVVLVVLGLIIAFVIFVASRDGKFRYERSGVINAPADKIFPFLVSFKLGSEWSPFEKVDPKMKKAYSGTDGAVGSTMEFEGNRDAGSGKLELLAMVPNQSVDIRLTMIKPIHGDNLVQYKLTPEGDGTLFTWTMSGNGGFMGKLMVVLIDCDKMIGDQFVAGITNLKTIVEAQK
ncbi:MAG: SRPBCC family protein [Bdellovibrio sp.]